MKQLEFYAENPFFTIDTSKDSIQKVGFDHHQRLIAAANPNLAAIIVETKNCWQSIFGNLQTYDSDKNEQQSFTIQVNAKMQEFVDKSVNFEGFVIFKLTKNSGPYQEFYPYGLNEFHQADQKNIVLLMERMVSKCHKYASDLGTDPETEFQTLLNDFNIIFASQKVKKGDVSLGIADFKAKSKNLFVQMFRNLGILIAEYPDKPEVILSFFDQTIVNYVTHIKTIKIQKNTTEAYELNPTVDNIIHIYNKSNGAIKYFFAPAEDSKAESTPSELAGKIRQKVKGIDAGAPVNKFIIFINETDMDANIELRLE
jgi:hypothetical protein